VAASRKCALAALAAPDERALHRPAVARPLHLALASGSLSSMPGRVLVVDDSATVRKIVRAVLEEAGYEVSDAPDGQQALEIIQRHPFDLCLVDFVMPRLNGYQFAQAVRSIAHLRTLPIVLMSAKADQIGERFMRQTAAIDAITKPFPPDAILAVVAHALGRKDTSRPMPTLVRDQLQAAPPQPPRAMADAFGEEISERTQTDAVKMGSTEPDVGALAPMVVAQANALQRLADMVAHLVLPSLDKLRNENGRLEERAVADALIHGLSVSELASVAR
jgi:CheY-like chemotaxis protein